MLFPPHLFFKHWCLSGIKVPSDFLFPPLITTKGGVDLKQPTVEKYQTRVTWHGCRIVIIMVTQLSMDLEVVCGNVDVFVCLIFSASCHTDVFK